MTGDKELEDTKSLEFKHGKRPEEAIQGDVIRFMYSPNSDPSAYWLQGTLTVRIDDLETAASSGWRKNRFEVNKISIIKYWGDLKTLPTTIVVNLTNETVWALGKKVESCSRKECDHNVRIHHGYDAIKTMNLISDNGESEEPDGYSHMTRHKYEVKLLPPEEGLSSLFETHPPSTSTKEVTNDTRRELTYRGQFRRPRTSAGEEDTLTVITQGRTIRRVYFNNEIAQVTFDTCSHVSSYLSYLFTVKRQRIIRFF